MHDLVIQRLFAGALSPQPALGRVTGRPKASERIQRVVADLDDTIKVIRSTIHALRESDRQTGTALRSVWWASPTGRPKSSVSPPPCA